MKTIIIAAVAFTAAIAMTSAQDRDRKRERAHHPVPQVVLDSFSVKFPGIANVEWEKERKHWEAEVKKDGTELKYIFDAKGNFLYTETPISISELPKGATDYVAAKFPGRKISGAGKISDVNGVVMYEVEIKGMAHLFFDAQGGYMNRED